MVIKQSLPKFVDSPQDEFESIRSWGSKGSERLLKIPTLSEKGCEAGSSMKTCRACVQAESSLKSVDEWLWAQT